MTPRELLADFETRSFALLVGVDRYRSGRLAQLSCAAKDVRAVREALIEEGGFSRDNVTLLIDEEATRDAVFAAFTAVADKVREARRSRGTKTRFLFYFAGHGVPAERLGSPETMLATYDADPPRTSSGVTGGDIDSELWTIAADQTVLIFDCCHAGGLRLARGGDAALMDRMIRSMSDAEGRVTICSSKDDELAYERPDGAMSVFAAALVGGLAGEADPSKRGVIYIEDVADHLRTKVADEARREHNAAQTPVIRTSLSGGSVLFSVRKDALEGAEKLVQKALVKLNALRTQGLLPQDTYAYCEGLLIEAPPPASTQAALQLATLLDFARGELRPEALRANAETWMGPPSDVVVLPVDPKAPTPEGDERFINKSAGGKSKPKRPRGGAKKTPEPAPKKTPPAEEGFFSKLAESLLTYGLPALLLLGAIFGWDTITGFVLGTVLTETVPTAAPIGVALPGTRCVASLVEDCATGGGRVSRCVDGRFVTTLLCVPSMTLSDSLTQCKEGEQRLAPCDGEKGFVVNVCRGNTYKAEGPCLARKSP